MSIFGLRDGLLNFVTQIGNREADKGATTIFTEDKLPRSQFWAAYKSGGVSGKICDCVADDLVRPWRDVSFDTEDAKPFTNFEKKLGVRRALADLIRWARCYSGAVILVDVHGDHSEEPLNVRTLRPGSKVVTKLTVRHRFEFQTSLIDPLTGRQMMYRLLRPSKSYHPSRVIGPFDGIPAPIDELEKNNGWGVSVIERCARSLMGEAQAAAALSTLITEAKTDWIALKGLTSLMDGGESQRKLLERYQLLAKMRGLLGIALIDADLEEIAQTTTTSAISGAAEAEKILMNRVSGESDIPMTRLFGELAAGLSTSGATNQQDYYDMLTGIREVRLVDFIDQLDELICYSVYGKIPDGLTSKWEKFREPTSKEQAEIDKINSETAQNALRLGAIVPSHVADFIRRNGPFAVTEEFIAALEKIEMMMPPDPTQNAQGGDDKADTDKSDD